MSSPILSAFDWEMHTGTIQHLRAGFLSSGSDGRLQYRYVDPITGVVDWRDLMTGLDSVSFNFCDFWNATNSQAYLLFVNGASAIYEWSGGVTTFQSATSNTITKQGAETFAETGFYDTGTHSVTINDVDYQATGGWGTATLTGVTPDPSAAGITGDVIHQTVTTVLNSAITSLPDTLENDLIANLRNQIYIGSLINNSVFISKVNNYLDFSFTSPVRVVGEGALVTMDGPARALIPQENYMTLFAGLDQIYQTVFTLSSDLAKEAFEIHRLKTTALQGTQSQALTSKIKNDVVFVSNEPVVNTLGRVDNVILTPQISDISFPIINDMNSYDFTDGSIFFWKNYILVAVPKESLIRIYNMTKDSSNQNPINDTPIHYWEAPLTIAISRFSIIDGELYGHSYLASETYHLFTGYNFNGHPIDARAIFAYNSNGIRTISKGFNEHYIEGYISPNATLDFNLNYELDGFGGSATFPIYGTDTQIVQINNQDNSLGKFPLGKNPLGGDVNANQNTRKFRVIKTFPQTPYYEESTSFTSLGVDFIWSILAFGPSVRATSEGNNPITE